MKVYHGLTLPELVALWRKEALRQRASRPSLLFHNDFTPVVTSYRWREDDGSTAPESAANLANEDASYDVDVSSGDVQLFLIVQVEEQGDDSANNNVTIQLQFDPAGGTSWQNVTASAGNGIHGTADGNTAATDEAAWTTGNFVLTGEEGTAYDGLELTDDAAHSAGTFDFEAANYTEFVFPITAEQANLSDSQSLTFAIAIAGTTITNGVTGTLTVTKSGTPPSGAGTIDIADTEMSAVAEQPFEGAGSLGMQDTGLDAVGVMQPAGDATLSMQDDQLDAVGAQILIGVATLERLSNP